MSCSRTQHSDTGETRTYSTGTRDWPAHKMANFSWNFDHLSPMMCIIFSSFEISILTPILCARASFINLSMKYLVMFKVYTDVGGIK